MATFCFKFLNFLFFAGSVALLRAQTDTLLFTPVSIYPYPAPYSAYTARFDRLNRPYLYTANKEYGVIVFDWSNPLELKPVRTFTVQNFQSLKPTDLVQQGNYLYVSLGGFDGLFPQNAGLAIIDVSNPANATLLGQWSDAGFNKGCAAVRVDGDYTYLGAMEKGVILLDISNVSTPKYVSHLELDLNWPVPPGLFSVPHARGFALRGDELWVCFDAGGLRQVDVTDKKNPKEVTKYLNAGLDAVAQPAYNTALIAGDYLFAAVDYCGFDVVDIADPGHPATAAWINPWNCTNTSWDGSPGHTNQVATTNHDSLLFLSGADSEVLAYAIADPKHPRRVGQFAHLQDSIVSWGLDVNDSLVVLAQVWNPLNMPYIAKKGGLTLLRWHYPQASASPAPQPAGVQLQITPNPVRDKARIQYTLSAPALVRWSVSDVFGRTVLRREEGIQAAGKYVAEFRSDDFPDGVYWLTFQANEQVFSKVLLKI